jgi:hypothetical protein
MVVGPTSMVSNELKVALQYTLLSLNSSKPAYFEGSASRYKEAYKGNQAYQS